MYMAIIQSIQPSNLIDLRDQATPRAGSERPGKGCSLIPRFHET